MEFNFERLEVWRLSMDFVEAVYTLSRKYPEEEKFALTSQLRRSATSISLNISEGSMRGKREFGRFIRIALGSLVETVTNLKIAIRLGYIGGNDYGELEPSIEKLYFKLVALEKSLGGGDG